MICGYRFFYEMQLSNAKAEMKHQISLLINSKKVIRLVLRKEESRSIIWENSSEFQYKGEMYDVIDKDIHGDELILTCVSDSKETLIINEYFKLYKGSDVPGSIPAIALLKIITSQYFPSCFLQLSPIEKSVFNTKECDRDHAITKADLSIQTPPPRNM